MTQSQPLYQLYFTLVPLVLVVLLTKKRPAPTEGNGALAKNKMTPYLFISPSGMSPNFTIRCFPYFSFRTNVNWCANRNTMFGVYQEKCLLR